MSLLQSTKQIFYSYYENMVLSLFVVMFCSHITRMTYIEYNICWSMWKYMYHKTSNIRGTIVGYKIVDHSDVVGASPVGTASTTSSFST